MSLPKWSYNPGLCRHNGKLLMTFRNHDRDGWRTSIYITSLTESLQPCSVQKIQMPKGLEHHSHEDARLFTHKNSLWMSWTVSQYPATVFRCVVVIGELVQTDSGWSVGKHFSPQFGKNDFTALEKNWCPMEHEGNLYTLYLTNGDKQTWLKLDALGNVAEVLSSKALPWNFGDIHGGCIAPYRDGKLVHFFHSRLQGRYHIAAAILAGEPPFDTLQISKRPIIYGNEGYCLDDNKRYKANVCFPGGAIKDGDSWLLAFGYNDDSCRLARLREGDLNL